MVLVRHIGMLSCVTSWRHGTSCAARVTAHSVDGMSSSAVGDAARVDGGCCCCTAVREMQDYCFRRGGGLRDESAVVVRVSEN